MERPRRVPWSQWEATHPDYKCGTPGDEGDPPRMLRNIDGATVLEPVEVGPRETETGEGAPRRWPFDRADDETPLQADFRTRWEQGRPIAEGITVGPWAPGGDDYDGFADRLYFAAGIEDAKTIRRAIEGLVSEQHMSDDEVKERRERRQALANELLMSGEADEE